MKNTFHKTVAVAALLNAFTVALGLVTEAEGGVACQQRDGMWGAADPNIFYICDEATNTPQQMRCAEGRGFFHGLGYYGCLPFAEWPACMNSANGDDGGSTQFCDAEHLMQPWQTLNPNKFYMCFDGTADPLLVNCEAGRGFVNATTTAGSSDGRIVGCAKWEQWRDYMQCREFY